MLRVFGGKSRFTLGVLMGIMSLFVYVSRVEAATGINPQINFQGKVVNTNGTNVANGNYDFVFKIYSVSSGGAAIWTETWNSGTAQITVTDGVFQAALGTHTALPGSIDFNTDNLYLGITFHTDTEMTPRIRMTAVPYAFNAKKVAGLTVTDTTGTLTIPNGKTISFADAFSTTGAFPLTLTSTATTTATLPSGTITLADLTTSQVLTNKTIGSTGLVFSGATTDITTASGENLVLSGAGAGVVDIQDATTVDSLTADTGGVSIAAGQSYTGAGAVTLSSASGANNLTIDSGSTGSVLIGTGVSAKVITIGNAADDTFSLNSSGLNVSTTGVLTGVTSINAYALAGTLDANTNIITNIGNAGTDFIASTGALTLAGVLTANGGISLSASQSLSAAALSFVDLGLITQGTTANQGLRLPNAASATPSNPTSGEGYLAWDTAGNQLITYNGSAWTTVGGSIAADSLDFTDFKDTMALDVDTTINANNGSSQFTLTVASNLSVGNRSTSALSVTEANNATYVDSSSGLLSLGMYDVDSTAPVLSILTAASGTAVPAIRLGVPNNGYGIYVPYQGNVSGTGSALFFDGNYTGALNSYSSDILRTNIVRDYNSSGTVTDTANQLDLSRSNSNTGAGTHAVTGALVSLVSSASASAGTMADSSSVLSVMQSCGTSATCSGAVLQVTNAGTGSSTDLLMTNASGTQAKGLYLNRTGAGTTTSAVNITASSGAITTGITIGSGVTTAMDAGAAAITNIGNAGTDFIASTGALTLAGVLTANGGISLSASQSLSAVALSYVDLGAIVHNTTANQGLRLPNAASATPSNPTSGEGYLAWDASGNQLITYNGSAWTTVGGGGYNLIKDETTGLTARTTLAFLGAGVSCADNASQTECTIAGGSGADLQGTYDTDANGSNATISLTAADDGLVFTNPTSGGTDGSAFLLSLTQQNTTAAVVALDITQSSNAAHGVSITANALTTSDGLLVSSSTTGLTGSGTVATFSLSGSSASNTGDIVNITNSGASNANVALAVNQNGTGAGIKVNNSGTGDLLQLQTSGVTKLSVNNKGGLTINGLDSSIVRDTTAQFSSGTVGSNLVNTNDRLELSDGTPASSGTGTITTASQPPVNANIGAGAMSISRPDGKHLVINGGAVLTTSIYDPVAGTFTAGKDIVPGNGTGLSAGAIALPRPNGMYVLIIGTGTTAATANIDPQWNVPSTAGPSLTTNAITTAGTVAFKRPDGKYLVTVGGGVTTQIYDPVANSFALGPPDTGLGNWGAGALAIPRPDGTALMVTGGSASTTAIYSPFAASATIGTFVGVIGGGAGPKLDGTKASGTCGINGAGSVALKRQDGQYVILSKGGAGASAVSALYDPVANTMTCRTSNGPSAALGDGAHAIPLQNGKFLIFAGGNTTNAFVYSQDTDSFADWSGTTPTAITTGAHSIMRPDGTWQVITGTNTCINGCTNNYSTNLPMYDPYPSQVTAGTPTSGGSCTAGTHSYYVTFIMPGSVESELSDKSNIVSCTAGNGTVGLTTIPVGPLGTTARKVYRTVTGDTGVPQLLTTIGDNTTLTYSDTTADGSLGAAYSVTAATTWYTSEDISSSYISSSSTLRWNAQLEATLAATRNAATNTAYKTMQFFVKTAVNASGCATPLRNAPWQEIQNSGDAIHAIPGANCVKMAVHFNRPMPKRLVDDRGTWTGNGSTVLRYDYVTPTLFGMTIDNSAVLKRYAFDFSSANSNDQANATVPAAPTSAAPGGSGACTSGNHFWFVTFVTNGKESLLSPASVVRSCSGSNAETLTIPVGPSGTTARKVYRTKAADLVTDTPFLVGTQSDNSTTSYVDDLADGSLGAAFSSTSPSGPTLSRGESSRVEVSNNQLTLPWGRITPTAQGAANALGFYMGSFGADHPLLNNLTGMGTTVIARDDKTFLIIEAGNSSGTADLYDPVAQTFTNQSGAGNVPTSATASGSFAIKRPDGKFLVVLGTGITTTTCTVSGTATNIYDQYAAPGNRFTNGPCLFATAGQGAFSIQNADGTFTIVHGNATTSTTIYDPVRNTMSAGPLQTTGCNVGALAIPLLGPNANIYKIITGTTLGGAVATATMNYNSNTKVFAAGTALGVGSGSGAFAFQRQDGFWILVKGTATGTTSIINPWNGLEAAGVALTTSTADRGAHVIPRADGTFLIIGGNAVSGVGVTTNIYIPWGGAWNATAGAVQGVTAVGPTLVLPGTGTQPTAPTSAAPVNGGTNLCTSGAHFWRVSFVTQGIESPLGVASATQTCASGTTGQENLTGVPFGPTGTTERRIYRTLAAAAVTAPAYYVGSIMDNSTATYSDSIADPSTGYYNGGGVGDGALSFQRPDGKWLTLFGGSTPSKTVNIYDAGWYADGQYLSEQMNVPAMAANSTLDWQQTPDQFVRMEVRSASSQTALSVAGSNIVSTPGGSIGNAGGETWVQVTVNFRRDFPTFCKNLNGVYNSTGGMGYCYRAISIPTVDSFQITNGMDLMTLQNNGLNVLRVTSNGNIMSSTGGGFFSGGADLAENYTSTQALDKGEVVMIDQANPEAVLRSTGQYQKNILGVVSTAPGFVAGGYTQDSYPIALVGRVPVRISTENGPIRAGDALTAASIPGYAMRVTHAGRVLGKALEAFDSEKAVACPAQGMGNLATTKCGSIMMFVNLTDYSGASLNMLMNEKQSAQSTTDGLTSLVDSTDATGLASSGDVQMAVVKPVTKEDEMIAFLKGLNEERIAASAPDSDILADRIAASESVLAPRFITDVLLVKRIESGSVDGLQIVGSITVNGDASFGGKAIFAKLVNFMDQAVFKGKVIFEDAVMFNSDTAGFAVISEGQQSVVITFDHAYATQPIVSAMLTNDASALTSESETDPTLKRDVEMVEADFQKAYFDGEVKYIVTNKSGKGFTIVLNKKAPRELQFSWVALAVKDAKIFRSDPAPVVSVPVVDTSSVEPVVLETDTETVSQDKPSVTTPLPSETVPVASPGFLAPESETTHTVPDASTADATTTP